MVAYHFLEMRLISASGLSVVKGLIFGLWLPILVGVLVVEHIWYNCVGQEAAFSMLKIAYPGMI
jgi:hypothetical protein